MLVLVAALSFSAALFLRRPLTAHPPAGLAGLNYRGSPAPLTGGLVLFLAAVAAEVAAALATGGHPRGCGIEQVLLAPDGPGCAPRTALIVALAGMFTAGLIDDAAGKEKDRGLRGHVRALARGVVTAGAMKAATAAAFGFLAGWVLEGDAAGAVLSGALVALSANLLNLFDLAPGRACKLFFAGWLPMAVLWPPFVALSLPVAASAAAWLPADLRERGMLGDSGAYLLGSVLGLGLAAMLGTPGKAAAAAALLALTVASEFGSFSRGIERFGPLRWVDSLGRRGEASPR